MFATRRSRALGLLGLLALVGWAVLRRRSQDGGAEPDARPARAPDAVASEDVTDDVHADLDATIDATPDVAVTDEVVPEAHDVDDVEEPVVTARVYEVSEPSVVEEPAVVDEIEPAPVNEPEPEPAVPSIDLDRIERDLEGVEAALRRLDDGSYWTDEVTGEALDDALLVADPVARRNVA